MDSALLGLSGVTCGYGLSPIAGLYCVTQQANTNSPFGENFMLFTLGLLLVIVFIVPLLMVDLNDNMIVQFASFAFIALVMLTWLINSIQHGFSSSLIPVIGTDLSAVVPNILFNYSTFI
jgi:fucose permease